MWQWIVTHEIQIELAEIILLAGYLIGFWEQEHRLCRIGFPIIIAMLAFDVFILQCQRPLWVCSLFNLPGLIGWLWLYEKSKQPLKNLCAFLVAFLSTLFM